MDVTLLEKTSLKIKTKKASFAVDPNTTIPKMSADAIISLNDFADNKVADFRAALVGPGEYEISGVKISGFKGNGSTAFTINADGMEIFLGNASAASTLGDKLKDHKVALINADSEPNISIINHLEPSYLILYGERASEWVEKIEKTAVKDKRVSITADKLPEELNLIVLE